MDARLPRPIAAQMGKVRPPWPSSPSSSSSCCWRSARSSSRSAAARKGARARLKPQSRREPARRDVLFLLSILVLGIAVPAFVIASEESRDSVPEAGIAQLTAKQKHGRELFGQRCRNCHTLKAANATAKIGPTLDTPRNEALVLDAIEKGRAGGNGNMPAQVFEGEEAEAVAEFVAVASGGELEPAEVGRRRAVHPALSGNSARTRLRFRRSVRKDVVRSVQGPVRLRGRCL